MSQPTQTSGDAAASGNTVSSFDAAVIILNQMSDLELPPPAVEPVSHEGERLSSTWRKEVMGRVINSLHLRTIALNDLVKDEKSKRLLVGKHHTEFPQSERAELTERVQALKQASQIVKNDLWELNNLYVPDRDPRRIGELIRTLTNQTADLDFKLALF